MKSQTLSGCLAIKKHMDDGEGVNRRAGSGRKTVVDRDRLRNAIEGTASNGILQAASIHNSLSTTPCTSIDTFAIVHALLDCVDACAGPVLRPHSL